MNRITLRTVRDQQGSRLLEASLTPEGALLIEGVDHGDGVEAIFGDGIREYEWSYNIDCADIAALLVALGATADILTALRQRFGDEEAAALQPFLDEQKISYRFWSRLGD